MGGGGGFYIPEVRWNSTHTTRIIFVRRLSSGGGFYIPEVRWNSTHTTRIIFVRRLSSGGGGEGSIYLK